MSTHLFLLRQRIVQLVDRALNFLHFLISWLVIRPKVIARYTISVDYWKSPEEMCEDAGVGWWGDEGFLTSASIPKGGWTAAYRVAVIAVRGAPTPGQIDHYVLARRPFTRHASIEHLLALLRRHGSEVHDLRRDVVAMGTRIESVDEPMHPQITPEESQRAADFVGSVVGETIPDAQVKRVASVGSYFGSVQRGWCVPRVERVPSLRQDDRRLRLGNAWLTGSALNALPGVRKFFLKDRAFLVIEW